MKLSSKTKLSKFFTTSPLQTAFGVLVIFSLLANIGVLLFVLLLHNTADFDLALYHYSAYKNCTQDYADVLSQIAAKSNDPARDKKLFAAGVCFRDYQTGNDLDISSLKPIK